MCLADVAAMLKLSNMEPDQDTLDDLLDQRDDLLDQLADLESEISDEVADTGECDPEDEEADDDQIVARRPEPLTARARAQPAEKRRGLRAKALAAAIVDYRAALLDERLDLPF